MRIHPKAQKGITLIELILSIVIISIALVGIFSVINLTIRRSADPIVQHQALLIAESYLDEILLKNYSGGVSANRADFDDVDDYNGLNDVGVQDQAGNAIATLAQYSVAVTVAAPIALPDSINAKRITVAVTGPGVNALTLVGYKADY